MNHHDDFRRLLLKGVFASGAGLLLGGCDSQPAGSANTTTNPSGQGAGAAPAAEQTPLRTAESPKFSQQQVQYQNEPSGDQRCETCRHFISAKNECQLVEGEISPQGWCTIWAA